MSRRFLLVALCLLGLIAAAQLIGEYLETGSACPLLGSVPACLVVFAGYALMVLSVFLLGLLGRISFWLGWLPVFALATVASVLEVMRGPVCPTAWGVLPQCFLSLALAILIAWVWIETRPTISKRRPRRARAA